MLYMVTFTINISHVSIYTSTMDPMGYNFEHQILASSKMSHPMLGMKETKNAV